MKTFLLSICLAVVTQLTLNAQYGGGNGSDTDPYQIALPEHLVALSNNSAHWSGKYFILTQDIDLGGEPFTPIGNSGAIFSGHIDGDDHTISNLKITGVDNFGTALIGSLRGSVKNLGIIDVDIVAPNFSRVAALVGILDSGSVVNCFAKGGIIDVKNGGFTGGLVGALFAGGSKTVEDCYSSVEVKAAWGSGGVVGLTRGDFAINRVAFYGTVTGGPAIVTIQNSPTNAQKNGVPPTNSVFAASTGASDPNATSLDAAGLLDTNNYPGFDFGRVWKIDSDVGYGVLQDEIADPELTFFEKIRLQRVESSDDIEWRPFGPGMAGYCEEFWCHPTDPNVMFMGPDMHVSYGTWDNGQSWQTLKDSDGLGLDMRRVLDIEFSRQNPDYGMSIDWDGQVYETTDRGRTWTPTTSLGKRHSELAVDPNNEDIWYIGAGDFWNAKANHKSLAQPNGVKFGFADYGHIWKTSDKGENWVKIDSGLDPDTDVAKIIVNPSDSSKLIMATSHGVLVSSDGGLNWATSSSGLPNDLPRDLTSFYDEGSGEFILFLVEQTIYEDMGDFASSTGGIYKSVDSGASWTSVTGNLGLDMNEIHDYFTDDFYHKTVATWLGITKNESKAKFTSFPENSLSVFSRIVVNPLDKDEIYVSHNKKHDRGFGPGEVWKTVDGGQTWIPCARNGRYWIAGTDAAYWQGRGVASEPNIEFAHMQDYMDHGNESSGLRTMEVNARGEMFIGVDQQTLRSSNGGESWEQIDDFETEEGSNSWVGRGASNMPGRFMLHETGVPGRRLLASGEHGLWKTTDLGSYADKSATAVQQIEGQIHEGGAHSVSTFAVHPNDPDTIYFIPWRQSHRGKLRRTQDGGQTWENIATIFEADNNSWENVATTYSMTIDPNNPDNMYFCSINRMISEVGNGKGPDLTLGGYGFYRSFDGGYTWELSNNGFREGASVRRITMDPDDSNTFYAALNDNDGGLFKSTDQGTNWSEMSIPAEIVSVNNVFVDRNTRTLYISCGRRVGSYDEGGVWKSLDEGATWEKIFKAPFVWQCESSPQNPDLLIISAGGQAVTYANEFKNPGVYLSRNGGASWLKINKNLGNVEKIVDVKPDPYDVRTLWCAGWGSGWFKATINDGTIKDSDFDGVIDGVDDFPFDPTESMDTDGDGVGNNVDSDDDGDGVDDTTDRFPLDARESFDLDGDGVGDNADLDDDGDGVDDLVDNCPTTPNADQTDINGDGFGDVCVSSDATVHPESTIGFNPMIDCGFVIQIGAVIGEDALVGKRVRIEKDVIIGDHLTVGDDSKIHSKSSIGNDVFIGNNVIVEANCVIESGVTLDDGVRVGAGTFVGADSRIGENIVLDPSSVIAPQTILGGVESPCTVVGDLDCDGFIGRSDQMIFKNAMSARECDERFVPKLDYDNDGYISRRDYTHWRRMSNNARAGR